MRFEQTVSYKFVFLIRVSVLGPTGPEEEAGARQGAHVGPGRDHGGRADLHEVSSAAEAPRGRHADQYSTRNGPTLFLLHSVKPSNFLPPRNFPRFFLLDQFC